MTDTSEGGTTVRSSGCSSFTTTSSIPGAEKPARISCCLRSCSLVSEGEKAEEKVEEKVDVGENEALEGKVEWKAREGPM